MNREIVQYQLVFLDIQADVEETVQRLLNRKSRAKIPEQAQKLASLDVMNEFIKTPGSSIPLSFHDNNIASTFNYTL